MQRHNDQWYHHPNERQSDVEGILFLLLSARASLLRHCDDELCLSTMEDCISSFCMQHDLADDETNEGIVWEEASVGALLRLLDYLHTEVSESLQDRRCAAQLKLCIERLGRVRPQPSIFAADETIAH